MKKSPSSFTLYWLPTIVGLFLVSMILTIWYWVRLKKQEEIQAHTQRTADEFGMHLKSSLESRIDLLQSVRERIEKFGLPDHERLDLEGRLYQERYPSLTAMYWIDPAYHIRWAYPVAGNESVLNQNVAFNKERKDFLDRAKETNQFTYAGPIDLMQGGRGFVILLPVRHQESFIGFLGSVFRYERILNSHFFNNLLQTHAIIVRDRSSEVYRNQGSGSARFSAEAPFNARGVVWNLKVEPIPETVRQLETWLDETILILGLIICLLLTQLYRHYYLAQTARAKAEAAEREARASNEKTEQILESITDAFYSLDLNWRFTYVNQKAEMVWQKSRGDLLGKTIWEVHPGLLGSEISSQLHRAMELRVPLNFETVSPLRNEWIEANIFPYENGLTVYFHGISQRKQIEEALKKSEARYRTIGELISFGVWVTDAQGHSTHISQSYLDMMGMTLEELQQNGLARVHPEDRQRITEEWRQCVQTGCGWDQEYRILDRHGHYQAVLARGVPMRDEQGGIIGWVGVNLDITERKLAEQALRATEGYFKRLVEANIFGVAFCDFRGGFIWANDALLAMVGYSINDIRAGKLIEQALTPPEWHSLDERAIRELRQRAVATPYEKEYIHQDGHRVPVLYGGALVGHPEDPAATIITFCIDLSERKRLETELHQRVEQLAEADRRKNEFLAMLAHELRNPLAPIGYAAEVLQASESLTPKVRKYLLMIDRQVGHMGRLLEDLLDISRITRGKIQLQPVHLDLRNVLDGALESVKHGLREQQLQVEYLRPPQPVPISGDPTRLEQVFQNLLNNAIKFTGSGGRIDIDLAVDCSANHNAPPRAVVRIRDTGVGIAADMLPRIFDLFAQDDKTLDRSRGGLGIGLTMARSLVELHGGRIQAFSEGHGLGSEFVVELSMMTPLETADGRNGDSTHFLIKPA